MADHPFIQELMRALGVNPNLCRRFILDVKAGHPVTVTVEEFADNSRALPTWQEFHLVPAQVSDVPAVSPLNDENHGDA